MITYRIDVMRDKEWREIPRVIDDAITLLRLVEILVLDGEHNEIRIRRVFHD